MPASLLVLIGLALVVLILSSALFSAIETSLFSLQPFHIERLKMKRASFAQALAKLMENGLVSRTEDAQDGRASRVSLTAAGRRKAEELRQQEEAFAEDILRRLPTSRREPLLEGLQDLLGAVRAATASRVSSPTVTIGEGV